MTIPFLKRLGLMVPALRSLHDDRDRNASEVVKLGFKLARANSAIATLVKERDRLLGERERLWENCRALRRDLDAISAQPGLRQLQNAASSSPLNVGAFRSAPERRLHIIGYVRTGTTILMDILNSSPEVFVFHELNLQVLRRCLEAFSDYEGIGFLEQFLERKRQEHPSYKSTALPLPGGESAAIQLDPDAYLDRLGRSYRYVGDKIATAHRSFRGLPDLEMLEDFLRFESDAIWIFTLRRPSENLASVRKMFPESNLRDWAFSMVRTNLLLIRSFMVMNRAFLVFHEDIGPGLIGEFEELLGTRHYLSRELIDKSHQASRGEKIIPAGYEDWMDRLDRCHGRLHELWKCDDSILKRSRTESLAKAVTDVLREMEALLEAPPEQ
jgi:hypothetical protein